MDWVLLVPSLPHWSVRFNFLIPVMVRTMPWDWCSLVATVLAESTMNFTSAVVGEEIVMLP